MNDDSASNLEKKNKLPSALAKMTSIQEVHDYYQKIISCMPNNVYWLDRDCITQGCNSNVLQFIGLKRLDEFVGIDYETMGQIAGWHEGHAALYQQDDMDVMASGKPKLNIEDPPLHDKDGNATYYLSSRVPIFNDSQDEVIGVVGISVDITARKKAEAELQEAKNLAESANQAKTEFLENMRHDIRTPLTGIVGFAEILKVESSEPRIKEYAENLVASSQALLHLMDEVLEAIRVSSGEIPKFRKKFNLKQTLEHVIALNRAKASQKKLDIRFEFDPEIPQFLIGDKIRLHRVALELLANALNFTDLGFVKLTVQLSKQEDRDVVIKLIVEDTGIGIPKNKQQDIYLQFKRLMPSYKGIYEGAGLGLSVIKQFIDDLNGEIYVTSEPGKGSKFTCLFLLQKALIDDDEGIDRDFENQYDATYEATYAHQMSSPLTVNETTNQTTHQILVVEDNLLAQKVAQSLLNQFQCHTDIANCGQQAVELATSNEYDLIFMDIGLPDMDGYEVTHRIRVNELSKKTHTPIIALTAHAGDENKKRCIEAGMNAVLTKPLTLKNCSDIIESFIPGQRKENADSESYSRHGLPENSSHLFELSQYPLLNLEEGIKTLSNKTALFEMLNLLINGELANDLAWMKKAHNDNDWDKIQQIAHKIKGGVVYVGATRLSMACQYLERYWKTGQGSLLEQLYQQVISVIDDSLLAIQEALSK